MRWHFAGRPARRKTYCLREDAKDAKKRFGFFVLFLGAIFTSIWLRPSGIVEPRLGASNNERAWSV